MLGEFLLDEERDFNLTRALESVAHWLPSQGPIKDFVHHNTLHAFQFLPFHDAVHAASHLYGARGYLDVSFYRKAYEAGHISRRSLARVIAARAGTEEGSALEKKMFEDVAAPLVPRGAARTGLRARWKEREIPLDSLVRPTLFKLLSNYLDQGVSVWRMPHADDTFWSSVCRLLKESYLPFPPLSDDRCQSLLSKGAKEAALFCLKRLVGYESLYERYLLEMLLSHPGWSGMVRMVEQLPESLLETRLVTLEDLVALELTLEYGWVSRFLGDSFSPVGIESEPLPELPLESPPPRTEFHRIREMWHEAFEWTVYEDVLSALELHSPRVTEKRDIGVQAFFCLDDRAESLRRHLEELDPKIDTFATAGFFGIDFLYQGFEDSYPIQSCPVAVKPQHLVRESRAKADTLSRGWLITQTLGLWNSIRLAARVFIPSSRVTEEENLSFVKANTQLHLLRESDEPTPEGYLLGYSFSEMADRVFGVLRSVGLTKDFAQLVVMIGHGSSSANNPHFAAYDCGACYGKPNAPNARAFAWMANRPEVRAILEEKGISIPDDTHFLPAMHDTSRDEIHYFDASSLPEGHERMFRIFDASLHKALRRNAKERCRRFTLVSRAISQLRALSTVRERAASIFEPRPELNHATNAICLVGRRQLSRGLFLDRRAFLNSYDPETDPTGAVLSGILDALVPVCAGINLEYYFSRVDDTVYGAGTKLPHNVVSLIGVANGVEGDLRTGLPSQMTELHDPVRLLLILEQTPDVALKAVTSNPKVFEWIQKEWVRLACISPVDRKAYFFENDAFAPCEMRRKILPRASDSLSAIKDSPTNLGVHEIGPAR